MTKKIPIRTSFRSITLLLAFLIPQANLLAQTRSLEISGPFEARSGQLIRLVAEVEPTETPFWLVLSPSDLDFEQVDDGRRLIFTPGCNTRQPIVVMLLAQSMTEGRIVTRQIRRQIQVVNPDGNDGNEPGTQPQPLPPNGSHPPDDPPPADVPSLEKVPMFRLVQDAFSQVNSAAARSKAAEVASGFELIAAECESGRITSVPQIWQTLSARNGAALGAVVHEWEPIGLTMQLEFQRLKLPDVRSHAVHLKAAALALRRSSIESSKSGSVSASVPASCPEGVCR